MNIFVNPEENRFRTGWRLAAQLFLMYFMGFLLIWLVRFFVPLTGIVLSTIVIGMCAVASIFLAAKGLDKRPWRHFGLSFSPDDCREYTAGFILGGLAMGLIFCIEYINGWLTVTGYGWQHVHHHTSFLRSFGIYVVFMIIVGFYEELLFRGYHIVNLSEGFNGPGLSRKQAVISAVVLGSLIFGVMHAFNPNANAVSTINVALAGGMLSFPFIITGRLSLSIGLHIGWNLFQGGIFGFSVSGLPDRTALINIQQKGPLIMTGGGFGPEAGLLGLLGMALVVLGLYCYLKKSPSSLSINRQLGVYHPSQQNYPA